MIIPLQNRKRYSVELQMGHQMFISTVQFIVGQMEANSKL